MWAQERKVSKARVREDGRRVSKEEKQAWIKGGGRRAGEHTPAVQ